MKGKKSTRSAFLTSLMSLVLCFAMLLGTTLAWFTDTASTAVNKIQAGTLDVGLEMKVGDDWVNAEGKTLTWQKAAGGTDEEVLWEPGCTYRLPELRIINKGNLTLKYKIAITGITGSAALLSAIDFTYGDGIDITEQVTLAPNAATEGIVIQGKMREDAGNEYQGLSIDGIGITVYATQKDAEYDSFENDYDSGAGYIERHSTIMGDDGKTITLEQNKTYTVGVATVAVDASGHVTYTNDTGVAQKVTIQTDGGNLTVNAPNDTVYHYGPAGLIEVLGIAGSSYHEFGKVGVLAVTKGRAVIEQGDNVQRTQVKGGEAVIAVPVSKTLDTTLEKADGVTAVTLNVIDSNGEAIVSKSFTTATGKVEDDVDIPEELVNVLSTSDEKIGEVKDYVASIGDADYYDDLQAAVNVGDKVKLLKNVTLTKTLLVNKTVTINMNGYNITGNGVRAIHVQKSTLKLDGVGTVSSTVENVGSSAIRVGDNGATSSASLYVYKDVTVSAEKAYGITAFGKQNENVYVYGTVTSTAPENPDFDGCAIATLGTDTTSAAITIYDGATVRAENTNAIYMPSGNLTVNDGATVTGRTGIYVKSGKTTIKGGTITGNGPAQNYTYYGNGGISTGDALVVDSCGYPKGVPTVKVSGGTFTSAKAKAVASYNTEGNDKVTNFISSGTFSTEPPEDYLYENCYVEPNTNGTYAVKFKAVAKIGDTYYPTLYDAVAASDSNKTIELLCDITENTARTTADGMQCVTGTLKGTLDGNGHKITLGKDLFLGASFGTSYYNTANLKNVEIVANGGAAYVNAYRGTFENVKISGSIEVSNNTGAFVIFGYGYGLTFKNCEMAATMTGAGTATNYNAAFVGYGLGSGAKYNFEDCKMTGSLTCGVAALFLGNDSQLKGSWKVNVNNFTFGENAVIRNTLTSGYNWKFNGIVAANAAYGTPVVTIDGTEYSGAAGFTQLVDAKNTIWGAEHFAYGPQDASLKLVKNADGTFTITPAANENAVKYVVNLSVYTTLKAGGSLLQSAKEEIVSAEGNITTTLKDLKFVDATWLENHSDAVEGTLAGNTIYTLDGESYYMISNNEQGTLNGNPKSAQVYGLTAYDANGNIVSSCSLSN